MLLLPRRLVTCAGFLDTASFISCASDALPKCVLRIRAYTKWKGRWLGLQACLLQSLSLPQTVIGESRRIGDTRVLAFVSAGRRSQR